MSDPNGEKETLDKETIDKETANRPAGTVPEALALLTQLGFTLALPIVLGALLGNYLDEKLGTNVLFLIVFILLGVAAGIIGAYHLVQTVTRRGMGQKTAPNKKNRK